jgi:large conductance mechanosensitive channel protein
MAQSRKKPASRKQEVIMGSTITPIRKRRKKDVLPDVIVPKALSPIQGFVDFIREQGVIGLAVGLVIGTQVKTLVDQLIASFISPLLGLIIPGSGNLATRQFTITIGKKSGTFQWGTFMAQLLSFLLILAVLYAIIKVLKLDKLDKKKPVKDEAKAKVDRVSRLINQKK